MNIQSDIQAQRQRKAAWILARLKETIPPVMARYPVDVAYAYGSVARGTVTPFSDVDIALVLSQPLPPYERLMVELEIQAVLEDVSGLKGLDVRAVNEAPLVVQGKVVQEGVLLYERDRARRVAFEVQTRKRYFDFAPVACRLHNAFLDKVHREGLLHG